MRRTRWEKVVADLDRVLDLCRRIGLAAEVEASRFLQYRTRLQRLIDLRAQPDAQNDPLAGDPNREGMIFGATQVEGLEFAGLASFLETRNRVCSGRSCV